jgi:hypothetical protein
MTNVLPQHHISAFEGVFSRKRILTLRVSVMPCQAMSMVVVHVASGTRDILVFWAAWPRLWATPYSFPSLPLVWRKVILARKMSGLVYG